MVERRAQSWSRSLGSQRCRCLSHNLAVTWRGWRARPSRRHQRLWLVPNYTAWWQRQIGVKPATHCRLTLSEATAQRCPGRTGPTNRKSDACTNSATHHATIAASGYIARYGHCQRSLLRRRHRMLEGLNKRWWFFFIFFICGTRSTRPSNVYYRFGHCVYSITLLSILSTLPLILRGSKSVKFWLRSSTPLTRL